MNEVFTIERYLKSQLEGLSVSDDLIQAALLRFEIKSETPARKVDTEDMDKMELWLLKKFRGITETSLEEDSDGGWRHKEGGVKFDSAMLEKRIKELERKLGLGKPIRIINNGITVNPKFKR